VNFSSVPGSKSEKNVLSKFGNFYQALIKS
jgi:hypothetical protein